MFPDASLNYLLDFLLSNTGAAVTYHLFKNNATITSATVLGDLTESDFPGYTSQAATEPGAATDGSHEAVSTGNTLTWTCTSNPTPAQQAFGLYVTFVDNTSTTRLLRADKFTSPVSIAFTGDQVQKKVDFYFEDYTP